MSTPQIRSEYVSRPSEAASKAKSTAQGASQGESEPADERTLPVRFRLGLPDDFERQLADFFETHETMIAEKAA